MLGTYDRGGALHQLDDTPEGISPGNNRCTVSRPLESQLA